MRAGVLWLGLLCPACFSSIDLTLLDRHPDAAAAHPDGGRPEPDAGEPPSCPAEMIGATDRSFCIDQLEVSVEQFADFLKTNPRVDQQPAPCAFNTNFVPKANWPMGSPRKRHPVSAVTWCDALAYCTSAGNRLCTRDEWLAACSNDRATAYPYGNTYDPSACNGEGATDTERVHTSAGCEGGFPGVFDLSGNVAEWIADCTGTMGENDVCAAVGGSFGSNAEALACTTSGVRTARGSFAPTLGFRCCR